MKPTDNFRRQHQELATLVAEIERVLESAEGQEMRRLLGRFAGKLQMHAAMEEKALYPRLIEHERSDVRAVAVRIHDEFGGIYSRVAAFVARWLEVGAIEESREVFCEDTRQIFTLLRARLAVEERELYAVADSL